MAKFYDNDILNLDYNNSPYPKEICSNNSNQILDRKLNDERDKKIKNSENHFDFNCINDKKSTGRNDSRANGTGASKYKNLDDEIFEDMQRQIHLTDSLKGKSIEDITDEGLDKLITPAHKESVRKIRELLGDI